jgi:hypothetical protein
VLVSVQVMPGSLSQVSTPSDRRLDAHRHRRRARRQDPGRGGGGSGHPHRLRHQPRGRYGVGDRTSIAVCIGVWARRVGCPVVHRRQRRPTHQHHCHPHRQIALVQTSEKSDLATELSVKKASKRVPKRPISGIIEGVIGLCRWGIRRRRPGRRPARIARTARPALTRGWRGPPQVRGLFARSGKEAGENGFSGIAEKPR